jgi:hypothetical protein
MLDLLRPIYSMAAYGHQPHRAEPTEKPIRLRHWLPTLEARPQELIKTA